MLNELAMRTTTDLMLFAEEAAQVHGIAKALSTTSFVPASMKGKPDEITGAILFGRELGMDPMTSLQTINVIQGRPTLTANAMRGLAMASGVTFRLDEATATRCVMSARRGGEWTTVTWTLDQARALGLTTKDNWKNQPGAMLIARATSQLCRLVAANVLIGMPYSTEEISDLSADEQGQPIAYDKQATTPAKPRTMRVKQTLPAEEPELVPEMETGSAAVPNPPPAYEQPEQKAIGYDTSDSERRTGPEEPVERPDMVTTKTRAALMAAFNERGIRDRTTRLARVSEILGREVLTVNMVSEPEARRVLAEIMPERAGWPETVPVP
jgi:hypothetical protein